MMAISNEEFLIDKIGTDDLFICAIGYEQRSYFLLDKIMFKLNLGNIYILVFNDHQMHEHAKNRMSEIVQNKDLKFDSYDYQDYVKPIQDIEKFVKSKKIKKKKLVVHVDYSSMPRSWYSRLPKGIENVLESSDKALFWYVEGTYPEGYDEYPSAGIDSFSFYSGRPTLRTENKRVHILSLGYDTIRTQAIVSILDPESMIVCNAYNSKNREISENVKQLNKELIAQAIMQVSLQMDDFSFMISKLCELAYEYQPMGDVIFIPDGPKPLILAMSLVPDIVKKQGVTCLHIVRNKEYFNPIDVLAKENIWGFSIKV